MKNRLSKNLPVFGLNAPDGDNYPKKALRGFCNGISAFCNGIVNREREWASNETDEKEYFVHETDLVAAANENSDGWYLIAPYGDFKHSVGVQRFDEAAANEIIGSFNSVLQRLKRRAGITVPVLMGHPDVGPDGRPGISTRHFDKTVYGKVCDLAKSPDGLKAKIDWKPEFSALPHGLRFSPFWLMNGISKGVWRPSFLVSLGLTSSPNIPRTSAANDKAEFSETINQKETTNMLKAILAALGYSEAEIENTLENRDGAVSEDAVKAKLAEVFSAAKSAQTQAETAKTAQDEAEKKLADAQTAAANERAKFAEYVVNGAIKAGKLTEADRAAKTQALVDSPDIVAAANEIDEAAKKVETASETDDLKPMRKSGLRPRLRLRRRGSRVWKWTFSAPELRATKRSQKSSKARSGSRSSPPKSSKTPAARA